MNYPFAQINTAVPSEISRIFKLCEEIGWAPEHVLEIYSKSLIPLLDDGTICSANMNQQKCGHMRIQKYEDRKSEILQLMASCKPIQFLQSYESFYYDDYNCTGVELGLAYNHHKTKSRDNMTMLFIDPSPYVVDQICKDYKKMRKRVILSFSNELYVDIYIKAKRLYGFNIVSLKNLKINRNLKVSVLYFSRLNDLETVKQHLKVIGEATADIYEKNIYAMFPTSMLDPKKTQESLRHWLFYDFSVKMIVLVDSNAIKSHKYKKQSFLALVKRNLSLNEQINLPRILSDEDVRLISANINRTAENKLYFDISNRCVVSANAICSQNKTIYKLFKEESEKGRETALRSPAKEYRISSEISIKYSGKVRDNGKIKPILTYQGTSKKGSSAEKKSLHYQTRNKTYDSVDDLFDHIEDLVFSNTEFRSILQRSILNQKLENMSVKTLLILLYDSVPGLKDGYINNLCMRVFRNRNSADLPLAGLSINQADDNLVIAAVESARATYSLSIDMCDNLILLLNRLFDVGVARNLILDNPLHDVAKAINSFSNQERHLRRDLTIKSFSEAQEREYTATLLGTVHNSYSIAALVKLYSPIRFSELCAMKWSDFEKVKNIDCHLFSISRYFEDKHTAEIPYLSSNKLRKILLVSFLVPIVKTHKESAYIELNRRGIPEDQWKEYPIFHDPDDISEPLTPDNLRRNVNKMINMFGTSQIMLTLADSDETTNISKYQFTVIDEVPVLIGTMFCIKDCVVCILFAGNLLQRSSGQGLCQLVAFIGPLVVKHRQQQACFRDVFRLALQVF